VKTKTPDINNDTDPLKPWFKETSEVWCGNRHALSDGPTHRFRGNEAIQVAPQRCTFPQKRRSNTTTLDKTTTQLHYIHADIHIRTSTYTHAYTYTHTCTATRATPQDRHHTVITKL
jgi:hypothetical protein